MKKERVDKLFPNILHVLLSERTMVLLEGFILATGSNKTYVVERVLSQFLDGFDRAVWNKNIDEINKSVDDMCKYLKKTTKLEELAALSDLSCIIAEARNLDITDIRN